jgi:oxygen-independent coproporphyrinogen-3 oxidase
MSIGVQSFSDGELSFLGRTHTSEDAVKAVEAARRAGFKNISIDMIYGLPGQTLAGWRENLLKAVELAPEHVSAYELTPECGTPLYESVRRGLIKMPDEGLAIDMFEFASDFLAENGFTHYEVSNYALPGPRADKPGYECRHNLNYWERGEYLGLGAGAHSFLAGKRLRNTSDIEGYIARILRGDLPVEGVEEISPADAVREVIFLGLRKTAGFDMRKAGLERADEALSVLARDGLVEVDGYNLKATRRGLLLLNRVAASLIEGAEGNAARHSTGASERTARCSEPSAKKQPRTPVP